MVVLEAKITSLPSHHQFAQWLFLASEHFSSCSFWQLPINLTISQIKIVLDVSSLLYSQLHVPIFTLNVTVKWSPLKLCTCVCETDEMVRWFLFLCSGISSWTTRGDNWSYWTHEKSGGSSSPGDQDKQGWKKRPGATNKISNPK